MASIWKISSIDVYNFGTYNEQGEVFSKLPITTYIDPDTNLPLTFTTGGNFPPGLIIEQGTLVGTLPAVDGNITYKFTITVLGETRNFSLTSRAKIWDFDRETDYDFGELSERTTVNIPLPLNPAKDLSNIRFSVISGKLPPGLRIENNALLGTPFEVARTTNFRFVIRATSGSGVDDRTFTMSIEGADTPVWITPPGPLPVGNNGTFYILDTSYIDFNLFAIDYDTATGQELRYTILDQDGELPPGLVLMPDGRLAGYVQPLLAIPRVIDNGNFDTSTFDTIAYDFGFRPSNGFDRFTYDFATYDLSTASLLPTKLNRNYEFRVTVSDGDSFVKRQFRIYVVGEDHFRADTEVHKVGEGGFTADTSYVKAPIWVTPPYLGYKRADNYHVFKLDVYDDPAETGPVVYTLNAVNKEVYGTAYTTSNFENKVGTNKVRLRNVNGIPRRGDKLQLSRYVEGGVVVVYNIVGVDRVTATEYLLTLGAVDNGVFTPTMLGTTIPNDSLIYFGSQSRLPPGMQFDQGTGEVLGIIPYSAAVVKQYKFTVTATRLADTDETAFSDRTFTVDIAGEVEQTLTWVSPENLGSIDAEITSTLAVKATTIIPNTVLLYDLVGGRVPPGLSLNLDGELVGKVNQFKLSYHASGLTTFEEGFSLDKRNTTIDRSYTFTVRVRDPLGLVEDRKTFTVYVNTPADRLYSNLVVKPFLKPDQRSAFNTFISDSNIFDVRHIYRLNDPNFGVQKDLRMLIYGGIETTKAVDYIAAMSKNLKPKKFKIGDVKIAKAKTPGTNNVVYEVIYLDIIDPLERGKVYLPEIVTHRSNPTNITIDQSNQFYRISEQTELNPFWQRPDPFLATLDNTAVFAGDPGTQYKFPSSVALWRKNIKRMTINDENPDLERVALTERNHLPLWMRSVQDGTVQELGYVKAVPLCYCKPGEAIEIFLNIKNSGFDFKELDYTVDRYIINRIDGYNFDKYLAFKNNRTTV
jgi:hypothetical protein